MAKLYFYYSAMNAGKTTALLQANFNYRERGIQTLCLLPEIATNFRKEICSRIGLSAEAHALGVQDDLHEFIAPFKALGCILIDEAQFLSRKNVHDLCDLVDQHNIPVLAYGLRTDFQGNLFEGSRELLALADHLSEIKTICFCGKKAILTARVDKDGIAISTGAQIEFGGNDRYIAFCRKHHKEFYKGFISF